MEKIYTISEMAKALKVHVMTLQRWDREGRLKAHRTLTNRRYYTESQYHDAIGITSQEASKRINVIYARVSNKSQMDDLQNQITFVNNFAISNGIPIHDVITDIGSGLNYKRKSWNKLIQDCFNGKINKIYVSYKDRFVRFGFDWFETFLRDTCGVEIVVIENILQSPQEELIQDLISIIHVFSCRIYGLRKYERKLVGDDKIWK